MKICLHRCPFLIQREIISKMSLQEAFSLSTTSRKSLVLFKWCLSHQRIHIQYSVWHSNHCIEVIRQSKSTDDLDKMTVVNRFLREHPSGPTWKFLGQNVGVMYGKFPVINVYIGYTGTTKSMIKVYRYLMDMFPKATISLKFDTKSGDKVTRIMEVAKVDEVEIGPLSNYEVTMAQAALDGCANTKKLRILNNSSFAWINPKSQFEMDHLYIKNGEGWIFNRHLMQHFLNCKQVILPNTSFGRFSKDYPEFMEIWMRGCKMELLRIGGRWIQKHRITDTVGVLPGAVEVRRARVWEDEEESENRVFEPGCCYMVQRADGTRAIASWTPREFLLTTNFVILEHPS